MDTMTRDQMVKEWGLDTYRGHNQWRAAKRDMLIQAKVGGIHGDKTYMVRISRIRKMYRRRNR